MSQNPVLLHDVYTAGVLYGYSEHFYLRVLLLFRREPATRNLFTYLQIVARILTTLLATKCKLCAFTRIVPNAHSFNK